MYLLYTFLSFFFSFLPYFLSLFLSFFLFLRMTYRPRDRFRFFSVERGINRIGSSNHFRYLL